MFVVQIIAVDLLNYFPGLDAAVLKAASLLCSSRTVRPAVQRRTIDVLAARSSAGEPAQPNKLAGFLLGSLLDSKSRSCRGADDFALLDCAARGLACLPSGVHIPRPPTHFNTQDLRESCRSFKRPNSSFTLARICPKKHTPSEGTQTEY